MRITLNLVVAAACVSFVGAVSASCASTTCEGEGTCDPATTPGVDGGPEGGADVIAPPNCDLTKGLKDSPACVDDSVAVFVSPNGDDGATGGKATPVKTISKGVELAASRGLPRVYVCEGTYDTNVEIKASLSVYGGLTCAWAPSTAKPKLAPPKGIALRVTNVSAAVVVEDFEVVGSADAGKPGDSAIAAFVTGSPNVTLRNVSLASGSGVLGGSGASSSNYSGATATKGGNASGALGGPGPVCTCTDGTSSTGGNGGAGGGGGLTDGTASPPVGVANSGASKASSCDPGLVGANGAAGASGQPATSAGALTQSGWNSDLSPIGAPNGKPAQGGGGGGTKLDSSSPGGGGGCGGCGGGGGSSGKAGGSSFALLSLSSGVTVLGGTLTTSSAGAGGAGGDGQDGQGGGAVGTGTACNGGAGGNGAGGSGGGGGAGGHSVPVAFLGNQPTITGATLTAGAKGGSGAGGQPGAGPGAAGAAGTPGPEGKAQNTLAL